jgi:hypothetical protein
LTAATDCGYTVIAYSSGTAVDSINTVPPGLDCSDICGTYEITNDTSFTENVDWIDCDDVPQTTGIIPGITTTICAKTNSIVTNLTPVFLQCGCV